VGAAGLEIGNRVSPSGDGDGPGADTLAARDVGRSVTDDDNLVSAGLPPEILGGSARCYGWQVGTMSGVGTVGADPKPIRIDASRTELEGCSLGDISGEQAKDDSVFAIEPVKEWLHPRHEGGARSRPFELVGEQFHVAPANRFHSIRSRRSRLARSLEQLGYDLGIGLAVESDPTQGAGIADFLTYGSDNSTPSRPGGQENGAVDIEQDELGVHETIESPESRVWTSPFFQAPDSYQPCT
jgi:hypothetical protein